MNANRLNGLYDQLSTRERFALILAAEARGDAREEMRLAAASPRGPWWVSDVYGHVAGLHTLAMAHGLEALAAAADFLEMYWRSEAQAGLQALLDGADDEAGAGADREAAAGPAVPPAGRVLVERMWQNAQLSGYLLTVLEDGWRLFCAGLGIDADEPRKFMPGQDTLAGALECARRLNVTPAEADAFVTAHVTRAAGDLGVTDTEYEVTARRPEDVAAGLRAAFDELVRQWQ